NNGKKGEVVVRICPARCIDIVLVANSVADAWNACALRSQDVDEFEPYGFIIFVDNVGKNRYRYRLTWAEAPLGNDDALHRATRSVGVIQSACRRDADDAQFKLYVLVVRGVAERDVERHSGRSIAGIALFDDVI